MHSKGILSFVLVLAVFAAGCVGGGGTSGKVSFDQNAGVKIGQFSFDVKELFEKDQTTLKLKVQNVGAKTMTANSRLWIYGQKITKSSNNTWSTSDADLNEANNIIVKDLTTDKFTPPNVELGIPGSVEFKDVVLTAPDVPENMKREDAFHARVCYPYSTTSMTKLVATTKNQLRTEPVTKTDAVTRASAGPIQLKMQSGENIIAGRPIQLVFDVTDVGGGFATFDSPSCTARTGADVSTSELNKVKVTVKVDGADVGCNDKTVTFSDGKGTLFCSAPATSTSTPKAEYTITAEAKYNYFLTQDASITVKDENL